MAKLIVRTRTGNRQRPCSVKRYSRLSHSYTVVTEIAFQRSHWLLFREFLTLAAHLFLTRPEVLTSSVWPADKFALSSNDKKLIETIADEFGAKLDDCASTVCMELNDSEYPTVMYFAQSARAAATNTGWQTFFTAMDEASWRRFVELVAALDQSLDDIGLSCFDHNCEI